MKVFKNKQIIFARFIIICLLFAFSKSEPNYFNGKTDFVESRTQGYNYLKIEVLGNNEETNYVVSVYSDSSRTNRVQLAQSFNGRTLLYHQLSRNENTVYCTIECDSNDCSGNYNTDFLSSIVLQEGDVLNYYVSSTDPWEFSLNSDTDKSNVWARGQKTIKTSLSTNSEKQETGNFYIVSRNMRNVAFSVQGEVGDFINVGLIGYNGKSEIEMKYESNTKIIVNGQTLTGFLKKGTLETICYKLQKLKEEEGDAEITVFGTGIILTKIAFAYILDDSGEQYVDDLTLDDTVLPSGIVAHILPASQVNRQNLCITFPKEKTFSQFEDIEEIVYTYHLVKGSKTNTGINLYEPQLKGILYPRITLRESNTAFIAHSIDSEKINFNMNAMDGFPQMYVIDCDNYPLCSLDNLEKGIRPRNINRYCSYSFEKTENYSPISQKQKLLVVKCKTSVKDKQQEESKYFDDVCGFLTYFYGNDDKILLLEDTFFNQYAFKNEVHNYKIQIAKENKIQKIFIDVMTYIGDVEVTLNDDKIPYSQYFSINKIYISVKIDEYPDILDEIDLKIKAKDNTYYTVLVNFGRTGEEDSLITNELQTGMSYLVTIDTTKLDKHSTANKQVKIKNERGYDSVNILVNFYSLNCDIQVYHLFNSTEGFITPEEITGFESLRQDIRGPSDESYFDEDFQYRIKVLKNDYSQYKGKLCKIYTSAIEVTEEHEEYTRDILVPDDSPQQIMFGKDLKHVSIGYVHVDFKNALLIKFNPKHKAQYKVMIYFENKESKANERTVLKNELIKLEPSDWVDRCKDTTRVCYIQIDITLEGTKDVDNPVLEFSVKSVQSTPVSYIQKNTLKIDYVENNKPQYYYAEIGVNEIGYVVANFHRGSGQIFAKVVQKDISEPEEGAEWKGKYKLPNEDDASMDPFTKELYFGTLDDCENGCYLLIKVVSDVEGGVIPIDRYYPYSIIVHSHEADIDSYNLPIIKIPTDEYIIGSINIYHPENRIFKFFSVWLNSDADKVVIDFQSDTASLFINVGELIPLVSESHYNSWSKGKDTVMSIDKSDLLKHATEEQKQKGLKDLTLTLGIWTNMTDSIFTSPFSFAVRLENGTENDIYRVNSDQKTLCFPKKIKGSNNYRCLYIIQYDYLHNYQNLILYANSEDQSAILNMYAKKVEPFDYELGVIKDFPSKDNSEYSSKSEYNDYLMIEESLQKEYYLLVSVESDKESTIEFYSCINLYQNGMTPNPSSSQLYAAVTQFKTSLNFPSDYMIMVNLVGVFGSAKLHWEGDDEAYYLKGRDDRLSITSSKSGLPHKLIVETTDNIKSGNGFIFYLNYNIRIDNANIDALNLYKSVNYVYTDNDLPILYYAPLTTFEMDKNDYYEIFFTFDDLEHENKRDLTFYENVPFDVNAYIVKENLIYEYKLFPYVIVESAVKISGVYDQAIRTGIIRVSKNDIDRTKVPEYERPYLYLVIDKTDEFKTIRKYKKIGVETTVLRSNSDVSVSELSNQFGLVKKGEKKRYTLKTNNKLRYMNLQFSCVEDSLSISIENSKDLKKGKTAYGKAFYSFEINSNTPELLYLIIENKKDNDEYFMFQYTFSSNPFNDNKYSISDTKISAKRAKNNNNVYDYTIDLSPVNNYKNLNLTYIVRLINGKKPKSPDVSIKVNEQVVKEFYNPQVKNDKLNLLVVNVTKSVNYVQVIAQIRDQEKVEYLSYQLSDDELDVATKKTDNKTALIVVIVIGAILFAVVVVLVIVIIMFNNKNKDLLTKVNQVSFAETGDKGEDNNLLQGN